MMFCHESIKNKKYNQWIPNNKGNEAPNCLLGQIGIQAKSEASNSIYQNNKQRDDPQWVSSKFAGYASEVSHPLQW
jgi:hypothetical protein